MSQTQSQARPAPAAPPNAPKPAPGSNLEKLGAMAEKLELLRVAAATRLEPDELAVLQAAVVELASLSGKPPGLAQPVTTPEPEAAPPPHQAAPVPPPTGRGQHAQGQHD